MDKLVLYRINSLLEHINLVLSDTNGLSLEDISGNSILFRATCFSVAQIGEMMIQLQNKISNQYPDLPWYAARKMRNVIVHDYGGTNIDDVYSTIKNDLPTLKADFQKIKAEIEKL